MTNRIFRICLLGVMVLNSPLFTESDLLIVKGGTSDYSIYCSRTAVASVKKAASEIQRVINVSSGVFLPIVSTPRQPMISLGENEAFKKLNISIADIGDESFKIITNDRNI